MSKRTLNGTVCSGCGSDQRPQARFCDQCGRPIARAAAPGRPGGDSLGQALQKLGRRLSAARRQEQGLPRAAPPPDVILAGEAGLSEGCLLIVHRALRGLAEDRSESLALEVEYRNQGPQVLRCSPYQWSLHDSQGYVYSGALYSEAFLGEQRRRLPEDLVLPGRSLRGWVAFACPLDAPVSHARFRESVRAASYLEFALPPAERRDEREKREPKSHGHFSS